jgi:hypothetical protein
MELMGQVRPYAVYSVHVLCYMAQFIFGIDAVFYGSGYMVQSNDVSYPDLMATFESSYVLSYQDDILWITLRIMLLICFTGSLM